MSDETLLILYGMKQSYLMSKVGKALQGKNDAKFYILKSFYQGLILKG